MKQILIIHGGTSFSSYDAYRTGLANKQVSYEKITHPIRWKENLCMQFEDAEVMYPSMPNSTNAVYDEWVVYFEKLIRFFLDDVQIVGHSLGAMFLAKYLHEHPLENPVRRLILVSGGYNDDSTEDLGSFSVSSAKNVAKSADEVHLFHSRDDPVVPFTELAKLHADIPDAHVHIFSDRGHFISDDFPEIINLLQQK